VTLPSRFVSWNVNGLRSILKKGFREFVATVAADVICLQEVRASPEQVSLELSPYKVFWNPALKPGYAGTAILTRVEPLESSTGLGVEALDGEGRVITLDYEDLYLVNVYTPNSQRGLLRHDHRTRLWDPAFRDHVLRLRERKPVIFCGDLNVAHREIDLAHPGTNRRNPGFTDEERAGIDRLIEAGFLDTFRELCQEGGHYTWWSNFSRARERNIGWRVDYFFISQELRGRLREADILPAVMGSDHCPITLTLQ
jgi:exodeoxyribonuclease-3